MPVDPTLPAGLGTYWESQPGGTNPDGTTNPAGVLDQTKAETFGPNDIPYTLLQGSDGGLESPTNDANAETLFPTYNGSTVKLPAPNAIAFPDFATDFAKAPTALKPDAFMEWHSAHQLEYILKNGTTVAGTNVKAVTIGTGTETITAVAAADGVHLYIVENLQKRDFATMPSADQLAISKTTAFTNIAGSFGLTVDQNLILNGDGQAGSPNKDGIDDVLNNINTQYNSLTDKGLMTAADKQVFVDLINNIRARVVGDPARGIEGMKVYSMTDIMKQVNEIVARFNRAWAFAVVPAEKPYVATVKINNVDTDVIPQPQMYVNVVSLDGGETIKQGYRVFIEQERRLLNLDNERLRIANTGTVQNKKLDVPNLVFLLQLEYNLSTEAKSTAETQEINQQNALLKTYAAMQKIINDTAKNFNHAEPKDLRTVYALKNDPRPTQDNIPSTDIKIISMFTAPNNADPASSVSMAFGTGGQAATYPGNGQHPLEYLRSISRPTEEFFLNPTRANDTSPWKLPLEDYAKPHWDGFATQLSDAVSLINQESQLKMNDINSMDKEKSRHFDLANSALQKMSEMIQNIARAGG